MSLFDFLRLVYRNIRLLIIVPVTLAVTVFLLTNNQPKTYNSSALIYTGFGSGYNIESGSDAKFDYKALNTTYDNLMEVIKSRLTLEEVGLRLLSRSLVQEAPNMKLGEAEFNSLLEVIPMEKRQEFVVPGDEAKTYQNLRVLYENEHPLIEKLIKGTGPYSIDKMNSISVKRVKSSDMISVDFSSNDPGLCKSTLDVLLTVFIDRYKKIKEAETGNVVAYFERELGKVKKNLNDAEDQLTNFRVKSRVINYGEETKALAIMKQNSLAEYAVKVMNLKATEAAIEELERKLVIREGILANNLEMVQNKTELADLTTTVAQLRAAGTPDTVMIVKEAELESMKKKMLNSMTASISKSSSKEGISGLQLVNEWLNQIIDLNKEQVTVNMYKKRLNDIDAQYDNFTPMGSAIDRMERQINVYEREYLEVLHGLNMAKLKQQNIKMTSNLEILDKPVYPYEPQASKRMLLVAVGFMMGIFSVLSFLIAGDLLDHSLRHPEKAKKTTGLEVSGALPVITEDFSKTYGNLAEQVTGILTSKIKLDKYAMNKNEATLIIGLSTQPKEGKSHSLRLIFNEMIRTGESVCLITPRNDMPSADMRSEHQYEFELTDDFVSNRELLDQYSTQYHYILMEIPAWVTGKIPVHLIEQAQLLLWTIRADKVWSTAHKNMLADLEKITRVKPALILNGVKPYYLDQVVAEVPVKRSFLATWVRKLVKFELGRTDLSKVS